MSKTFIVSLIILTLNTSLKAPASTEKTAPSVVVRTASRCSTKRERQDSEQTYLQEESPEPVRPEFIAPPEVEHLIMEIRKTIQGRWNNFADFLEKIYPLSLREEHRDFFFQEKDTLYPIFVINQLADESLCWQIYLKCKDADGAEFFCTILIYNETITAQAMDQSLVEILRDCCHTPRIMQKALETIRRSYLTLGKTPKPVVQAPPIFIPPIDPIEVKKAVIFQPTKLQGNPPKRARIISPGVFTSTDF